MTKLIVKLLVPALALSIALVGTGCESKERQMRREEAARAAAERDANRERIRRERANYGRQRAAAAARAEAAAPEAAPEAEPVDFSDVSERARKTKPTFADPRQEQLYRAWVNIDYPTRRLSDAEYAVILAIGVSQEALDKALQEREAAIAELQNQRFQEEQQAIYEAQLRRIQAEANLRARVQLQQELEAQAGQGGAPAGSGQEPAPGDSGQNFPRSYD